MENMNLKEAAVFIREDLRLKTFPVAVKFLKDQADFPEKARRPSIAMGKKIAICQGITMVRTYGWTIGLAKEDIICVPAAIAFGFTDSADPSAAIAGLFHEIGFSSSDDLAMKETSSMSRFENREIKGIVLAPMEKAKQCPRVVIPGNGERIFAATQDDEMALAFPIKCLADIVKGLKEAAKAIGVRYPVTPYQNFQPELPAAHVKLGKELGIL